MRNIAIAAALIAGVSTHALAITGDEFLAHYHVTAADLRNRQVFEKIYSAIKAEIGSNVPTIQCQSQICLRIWSGGDVDIAEATHPYRRYFCATAEHNFKMCLNDTGLIITSLYDPVSQTWGEGTVTRTAWPQ
jgi:hypothetical protein